MPLKQANKKFSHKIKHRMRQTFISRLIGSHRPIGQHLLQYTTFHYPHMKINSVVPHRLSELTAAVISRTSPGPQDRTHPLTHCTPLQCAGKGWWQHRFLWAHVSLPVHAALAPSSTGSLSTNQKTGNETKATNQMTCPHQTHSLPLNNERITQTRLDVAHLSVWQRVGRCGRRSLAYLSLTTAVAP